MRGAPPRAPRAGRRRSGGRARGAASRPPEPGWAPRRSPRRGGTASGWARLRRFLRTSGRWGAGGPALAPDPAGRHRPPRRPERAARSNPEPGAGGARTPGASHWGLLLRGPGPGKRAHPLGLAAGPPRRPRPRDLPPRRVARGRAETRPAPPGRRGASRSDGRPRSGTRGHVSRFQGLGSIRSISLELCSADTAGFPPRLPGPLPSCPGPLPASPAPSPPARPPPRLPRPPPRLPRFREAGRPGGLAG